MKFLCDRNLGKLAKWLRILGYDTLYEASDEEFLREADQEGRIALTRNTRLAGRNGPGRIVLVRADRVHEQIGELIETLSLKPDPKDRMNLCARCNKNLLPVPKAEVEEKVPVYVFQNCPEFRKCPVCERIYWSGSHPRRVADFLRRRIQTGPL
jgi:uncharacterized protein